MVRPWVEECLEILRDRFGKHSFSYNDARLCLKKAGKRNPSQVKVVLSELRRSGDLIRKPDSEDARKKVYKVKPISGLLPEGTTPATLTPEEWKFIWFKIINLLRFRRDFTCLPLLIYLKKYCEKSNVQWVRIATDSTDINEAFSRILKTAIEDNPQIQDVFGVKEFIRFVDKLENRELLGQFVELLGAIPLERVDPHVLGQAYEHLLIQSTLPNQTGYYSIPWEIIRLFVELLDPQSGNTVYDPWTGIGSTLIECFFYVQEREGGKGKEASLSLLGREGRTEILAQVRKNLWYNGITDAQVFSGDNLSGQKFRKGEEAKSFDILLSIPPSHFGLPPGITTDWEMIRNMLALSRGRAGLVLESACLSRGRRERAIRAEVVKDDLIEGIIQLPQNLCAEMTVPPAILLFNKTKPPERKNKVFFIDANWKYGDHPETKRENHLGAKEISGIVKAFRGYRETQGFSRRVSIQEVEKNDWNLAVPPYVNSTQIERDFNISKLWEAMKTQQLTIQKKTEEIEKAFKTLGMLK